MKPVPRFQTSVEGALSEAMTRSYAKNGVLVLEDFASAEDCQALMDQAVKLVAGFSPGEMKTVFSTKDTRHLGDDYFEGSGDKIRFFFEEDAFDDEGNLIRDRALSINKIGHALHDLDPVFDAFSRRPALARLARDLGVAEPLLLQSMYIYKQPLIGGEVGCHQDSTYLYTEPLSCTGFWFALEDATIENGCLYALPGRHMAPMKQRHHRNAEGRLVTDTLDPDPWPEDEQVPLEVAQGTLVVLHGKLPHLSGANHSHRSRQAYSLHVIDGSCRYPAENWLQRGPDMPLRGF